MSHLTTDAILFVRVSRKTPDVTPCHTSTPQEVSRTTPEILRRLLALCSMRLSFCVLLLYLLFFLAAKHVRGARTFREPGVSRFSAQLLRKYCGELQGYLRRLPCFLSEMTKMYCGYLRRRRVPAKTVQKDIKVLAREIPYGLFS